MTCRSQMATCMQRLPKPDWSSSWWRQSCISVDKLHAVAPEAMQSSFEEGSATQWMLWLSPFILSRPLLCTAIIFLTFRVHQRRAQGGSTSSRRYRSRCSPDAAVSSSVSVATFNVVLFLCREMNRFSSVTQSLTHSINLDFFIVA